MMMSIVGSIECCGGVQLELFMGTISLLTIMGIKAIDKLMESMILENESRKRSRSKYGRN